MGIIEEAAFGDFRFVPEEEEVLPLKAYALASALILFSYSESIGVLTEETVGCVAVSFFCAMVNGLAREVLARYFLIVGYSTKATGKVSQRRANTVSRMEKKSSGKFQEILCFSSITQCPTTEALETLPNVSWNPYRE